MASQSMVSGRRFPKDIRSGWNWNAMIRRSGQSRASGKPSSDQATARRPSPSRPTAWWWEVLDQVAPQGHADQLHPPADPQDGLPLPMEGAEEGQLRLIPRPVRGMGAPVLLAVEGRLDVPSAAQQEPGAAGVGGGAAAGHRLAPRCGDGGDVVVHPLRLAGDLDPGPVHGRHWTSRADRALTKATISSTAPSTPVVLESSVRS